MARSGFIPLKKFFESDEDEKDQEKSSGENQKLIDAIDSQVQRRMGDISKMREMYTDIAKEAGDSEETKRAFLDRIGNMLHVSDEGQDDGKEENGFRVPSKV